MRYTITKDYIYIQEHDDHIEGIPLKLLSDKELGQLVRRIAKKGEIVLQEDVYVRLDYKDE